MGATTIASILSTVVSVGSTFWDFFQEALDTMTSNPLLFTPIVLALFFLILRRALGVIRKFGVRGAR